MNRRFKHCCDNTLDWKIQVTAFEYNFRWGKLVVEFIHHPVSLRFTAGLIVGYGSLAAVELRNRQDQTLASCDVGRWRGPRIKTGDVEHIRTMGHLWRQVHDEIMRQNAQLYPRNDSSVLDTAVKILHGSGDMADGLACYEA